MRFGAGVLLVFGVLAGLTGCRVDTTVAVVDRGGGHGTVTVTVALDQQALGALGGETGLARQLSVGDLRSAGWQVMGPVPTSSGSPGSGGARVSVSHGFSSPSDAERLLAELAGSGPAANRPFRLSVVAQRGFLHIHDTLVGKVDLTCGLSCFGDQGLQSALGNPNGVATTPLLNQSGERPDQLFGFTLSARMPGKLKSDNAPNRSRSELTWTTPLGEVTEISAESESLNTRNIVAVAAIGALVIVGSGTALILRRRHRSTKHRRARRRRVWPFRRGKADDRAESGKKVKTG